MPFNSTDDLERQLDSMPMVEPPGLKATLMAQIRFKCEGRLQPADRLKPVRAPFPKRYFAFAYAAAAIIIIVLAIRHAAPPQRNAAASMVAVDVEEAPVIAHIASDGAELTVRGNGELFLVEAPRGIIDWDRARLTAVSFRNHGVVLRRRAAGQAVVRLSLPDHKQLSAAIDLR